MIEAPGPSEDQPTSRMRFDAYLDFSAVALLSAASVLPNPVISAVCATAALVLLAVSIVSRRSSAVSTVWAGVAAIVVLLLSRFSTVGPFAESFDRARTPWILLVAACLSTAVVLRRSRAQRRVALVLGLLAVLLPTAWMLVAEWDRPVGTDVYLMHQAGGAAIIDGRNPYGPIVRVPSGSPHVPEGTVVEGYAYPPVVLMTYAVAAESVGDPRLVSFVVWVIVLTWVAIRADGEGSEEDRAFGVFLLLAGSPVWPVIWFTSWTEPLSLLLFLGAAVWWRRSWVTSAVLLGLALASKQYFVFLAPLLLFQRAEKRSQRATVALGVAGLVLLPPLMLDPAGYIRSTVLNLADIGFRPDSQSLSGLFAVMGTEVSLPLPIWLGLGLIFSAAVARLATSRDTFTMVAALVLGFAFLIGQGFPNYWFVVTGLAAIGVCLRTEERSVGVAEPNRQST